MPYVTSDGLVLTREQVEHYCRDTSKMLKIPCGVSDSGKTLYRLEPNPKENQSVRDWLIEHNYEIITRDMTIKLKK